MPRALKLQDRLMPLHTRSVHRDQPGAGEICARPCSAACNEDVRLPLVPVADEPTRIAIRDGDGACRADQLTRPRMAATRSRQTDAPQDRRRQPQGALQL